MSDGAPGRNVSYLEAEGDDRWRVAEGRERGEVLRVVRDPGGEIPKLYFRHVPVDPSPLYRSRMTCFGQHKSVDSPTNEDAR